MPVARTRSVALLGLAGSMVEVEADLSSQLPGISIIGLPDAALAEARERVRSAATEQVVDRELFAAPTEFRVVGHPHHLRDQRRGARRPADRGDADRGRRDSVAWVSRTSRGASIGDVRRSAPGCGLVVEHDVSRRSGVVPKRGARLDQDPQRLGEAGGGGAVDHGVVERQRERQHPPRDDAIVADRRSLRHPTHRGDHRERRERNGPRPRVGQHAERGDADRRSERRRDARAGGGHPQRRAAERSGKPNQSAREASLPMRLARLVLGRRQQLGDRGARPTVGVADDGDVEDRRPRLFPFDRGADVDAVAVLAPTEAPAMIEHLEGIG